MLSKLHTQGNKIMQGDKEFQIKGSSINSPGLLIAESHDFLSDIHEIKKLGLNAVKVPICPAYFQSMPDYFEKILDPIVSLCNELNLYCCLDWHAQGNIYYNKTREFGNELINGFEKFDANKEVAINVLKKISKRYGNKENVMFEVFSSPQEIDNICWADIAQELVSVVRKNTNNIVFVAGTSWGTDLSWVFAKPISFENIVYTSNYYSLKAYDYSFVFEKIKKKYPVLFAECGWQPSGYFAGTRKDYGEKLKKYVVEEGISFFAWVYHPKRVPVLLNSWDPKDLSEWGKFLKEELL